MNPWYDMPQTFVDYFTINFKNLKIMIGSRPDLIGVTINFAKSIDMWISVSDRMGNRYTIPPWTPSMFWYPLPEGPWGYAPFFWIKKLLDRELSKEKSTSIYVHCDHGLQRSPLIVYHWLLSHLSEKDTQELFEAKPSVYQDLLLREKLGQCPPRKELNNLYEKMNLFPEEGFNKIC